MTDDVLTIFVGAAQAVRDMLKKQVDIYEKNFGNAVPAEPHEVYGTKTHFGATTMEVITEFDDALEKVKVDLEVKK